MNKVIVVGTQLNDAQRFIAMTMQDGPQFEIVDTRQFAYSHQEWACEKPLQNAYPGRYHIAGRYFWNARFDPAVLKDGIQRVKRRLDIGHDIILLCTDGVPAFMLAALRGAVDGVEIKTYNGVIAVEASQQALF